MSKIKILIVEDEVLIAKDIAIILEGIDYAVSGIAYDGTSALEQIRSNSPDLVLLDIQLGSEPDGIQIAHIIQKEFDIPFIFLTSYATEMILEKAKRTNPMGYIVKPFTEKDLFSAIKIGLYNYSQLVHPVRYDLDRFNKKIPTPLSSREFELLCDIYEGKSNQQLVSEHFISINTVKTHIRHLFEKLNVQSRTEAIVKLRDLLKG